MSWLFLSASFLLHLLALYVISLFQQSNFLLFWQELCEVSVAGGSRIICQAQSCRNIGFIRPDQSFYERLLQAYLIFFDPPKKCYSLLWPVETLGPGVVKSCFCQSHKTHVNYDKLEVVTKSRTSPISSKCFFISFLWTVLHDMYMIFTWYLQDLHDVRMVITWSFRFNF